MIRNILSPPPLVCTTRWPRQRPWVCRTTPCWRFRSQSTRRTCRSPRDGPAGRGCQIWIEWRLKNFQELHSLHLRRVLGQVNSLTTAASHSGLLDWTEMVVTRPTYIKDRGDEGRRPTWAGVVQAKMVGLQTTPVLHFPGVGLPSTHVVYSLHFSGSFKAMIVFRLQVG